MLYDCSMKSKPCSNRDSTNVHPWVLPILILIDTRLGGELCRWTFLWLWHLSEGSHCTDACGHASLLRAVTHTASAPRPAGQNQTQLERSFSCLLDFQIVSFALVQSWLCFWGWATSMATSNQLMGWASMYGSSLAGGETCFDEQDKIQRPFFPPCFPQHLWCS